ncbi:MAG TPA: ERF family protein, partial [Casimicrobiaceae bacterium]|nr:ERF family protein [Casimicrobiaceae bacterium]
MKTSDSIANIAPALALAQGKIGGARKDAKNPHFNSRYADLASCWDACREALSANGISVVQMTDPSERDEIVLDTRLLHSSGEWIEGRMTLPVSKADAQGYG